jgi:hypothetical protein
MPPIAGANQPGIEVGLAKVEKAMSLMAQTTVPSDDIRRYREKLTVMSG